ncbi:MAG: hypothetical protein Q9169_001509 [Polycauliona sp. 2 TL-2023]
MAVPRKARLRQRQHKEFLDRDDQTSEVARQRPQWVSMSTSDLDALLSKPTTRLSSRPVIESIIEARHEAFWRSERTRVLSMFSDEPNLLSTEAKMDERIDTGAERAPLRAGSTHDDKSASNGRKRAWGRHIAWDPKDAEDIYERREVNKEDWDSIGRGFYASASFQIERWEAPGLDKEHREAPGLGPVSTSRSLRYYTYLITVQETGEYLV